MRINPQVLGCCGIIGISSVYTHLPYSDGFWGEKVSKKRWAEATWKFGKSMARRFKRGLYDGAAVQINLASYEKEALKWFEELGFIKVELGVNANSGYEITTFFCPMNKWWGLIEQWDSAPNPTTKKENINPFIKAA